MIYVINKADKTKEQTRKVTVDFFKNKIGFTDDEIIFVDLNEFEEHYEWIETKFNAEAMKKFARPIFEDTQHGIAKQVLNISICECPGGYEAAKYNSS